MNKFKKWIKYGSNYLSILINIIKSNKLSELKDYLSLLPCYIFCKDTLKFKGYRIKFPINNKNLVIGNIIEIFYNNIYSIHIENNKNPIIFDLGANIGIATLYYKYIYPKSYIYCVEPNPIAYKYMKLNIEHNKLNNVFLYNRIISEHKYEFLYLNSDIDHSASIYSKKYKQKI